MKLKTSGLHYQFVMFETRFESNENTFYSVLKVSNLAPILCRSILIWNSLFSVTFRNDFSVNGATTALILAFSSGIVEERLLNTDPFVNTMRKKLQIVRSGDGGG